MTNIGLNLTDDQKDIVPSSPKRNNVSSGADASIQDKVVKPRSPNSTPTDEEGFSTDDEDGEWRRQKLPANDQKLPIPLTNSEDNVAITALTTYMKVSAVNPLPLPPKRMSFVEKKQEISDSEENMSPIEIGPVDRSCVVDDQYDIPRSYNFQPSQLHSRSASLITSTPNLVSSPDLHKSDMNFYSNFAPSEQMVFRFDHEAPPVVNRTLKPGSSSTNSLNAPPIVNRTLKPGKTVGKSRVRKMEFNFIDKLMTHKIFHFSA